MEYQFKTTATMKEYNRKKWWIDPEIIRPLIIEADSLEKALEEYREIVSTKFYVDISKNALRCKNPMYIDTKNGVKQVGYVITGKTDFESNYKWIPLYIELWVTIHALQNVFPEVEL